MLTQTDGQLPAACWNSIGVWGQTMPRCERLAEVFHCRNCLVYIRAGRRKLDEPVPAHYDMDWARLWTQKERHDEPGDLHLLVFRLHETWLALPLAQLLEVLPIKVPSPLPHRNPEILRGLTQVRGELCLHISLSGLFGMHQLTLEAGDHKGMLLYVRACGWPLVFAVSEVVGMHSCLSQSLQAFPESMPGRQQQFSRGMCTIETPQGIQHVCVLDTERWSELAECIR